MHYYWLRTAADANSLMKKLECWLKKLSSRCCDDYPIIHAAFLELADPLIPDGLQKCIDEGASKITVLPYFLNTGRHVAEDIPGIVDEFRKTTSIDINIAEHLGASDLMLDFLVSVASYRVNHIN